MHQGYPKVSDAIVTHPTTYDVDGHELVVAKVREGCWTVTVDRHALSTTYSTQAGAWEAGVREVYRTDAIAAK